MLTAPKTWGKILKLSELQVDIDVSPWRELVMERTGNAPLFFKGEMSMDRLKWFLYHFLSVHWEKTFHIDVHPIGYTDQSLIGLICHANFLNTSPRSIKVFHFPRVGFNLRAPWVANLRAITLSSPFCTHAILGGLQLIPGLEHAQLHNWLPDFAANPEDFGEIPFSRHTSIPLPYLTYLHLNQGLSEVSEVLQHVVPNKECEYNIHTFEDFFTNEAEWDVLSSCLKRRIDIRSETILHLSVQDEFIELKIVGNPTAPAFLHRHGLQAQMGPPNDGSISTFLTRFRSHQSIFCKVTGLAFYIDDDCKDDLETSLDSFREFFSFFTSISMLQLSQKSLHLLTEIDNAQDLFPSLDTLQLDVHDKHLDSGVEALLGLFLNQRRLGSKAIKQFYLTPEVAKSDVNWSFLAEFPDLKVVSIPEELPNSGGA